MTPSPTSTGRDCRTWSSTNQVHNASWAFPSLECARCGCMAWDPDELYCHTCVNMLGIQIAEEAGHI